VIPDVQCGGMVGRSTGPGTEDGAVFAFGLAISIHGPRRTPSFLIHGGGAEACQSGAFSASRGSESRSSPMPISRTANRWPLLPDSLPDGTRYGVRGGTGHRSIQHAESARSNSFAVISVSASDLLAGLGLNSCALHTAAVLLRALFNCVSEARPWGFGSPGGIFGLTGNPEGKNPCRSPQKRHGLGLGAAATRNRLPRRSGHKKEITRYDV
jgi:hypothetical protein